jgi:galactosylceramidase
MMHAENFILSNMTSTLSWATLWAVYPNVDVFEGSGDAVSGDKFWGPGLLYAWQPWSGHYAIPPTVWASAHTCQFSEVGWTMPFKGAGALASGGSYLTLMKPNSSDFSVVIETASAACHRCGGFSYAAEVPQMLQLEVPRQHLGSGSTSLSVWSTNETHQFVQLTPLHPVDTAAGVLAFSMEVQPQTLYTITSTTGQQKGAFPTPIPPSAAFPSIWRDGFDTTPDENLGTYWADQCGSFQVMPQLAPGNGKALRQRVDSVQPGVNS